MSEECLFPTTRQFADFRDAFWESRLVGDENGDAVANRIVHTAPFTTQPLIVADERCFAFGVDGTTEDGKEIVGHAMMIVGGEAMEKEKAHHSVSRMMGFNINVKLVASITERVGTCKSML